MRIYRQNGRTQKEGNTNRVRRGFVHALATLLFCVVLSIGTVCFADEVPATVTVVSAKIRESADPSSKQLGSAKQGGTVSIIGQTTGTDGKTWYQVFVDANTKGFIRADLVQVTGDGTINTVSNTPATDTTAATTPAAETTNATAAESQAQVTAVDKKSGTVKTNNVRIRTNASTDAGVVATANRGMVVTVTGEAPGNDGKTWYQISFTYNSKEITGFIRSDLVTFDTLPAETAESTITGTSETQSTETETTEPSTEETAEAPQTEEAQQEESSSAADDTQNIILLNVEETPYIMPEFRPIILKWEGQDINAFQNGDFYIFYAQKQNGEEGWYVFDSSTGVYQRYAYSTPGVTVPEESTVSGSLTPIIILVVIIVILIVTIGLMFVKLREYTTDYGEYDEDGEEEEEYGEDEEIEDLTDEPYEEEESFEEEEEPERPVRRPVQQPVNRRQPEGQQMRRPQGQASRTNGNAQPVRREEQPRQPQGGQQVRHPEVQQVRRPQNGQPVRRPEGETPVRRPEGEAPVRRPVQGRPEGRPVNRQPVRRQEGAAPARRPQGQVQRPVQNAGQMPKGHKAKNILENEDDDMEFIDI